MFLFTDFGFQCSDRTRDVVYVYMGGCFSDTRTSNFLERTDRVTMHNKISVAWFETTSVFNAHLGDYVVMPSGPVCKIDGVCCEAFPSMFQAEVIVQYNESEEFRLEYALVRRGVEAAGGASGVRPETVTTLNILGMRLARKMAWVHKDEFARCGGGELGSPGCSAQVLQMPTYEGGVVGQVIGTVVEMHDLPPDCRYETVELFLQSGREHNIELLGPSTTFRKARPAERYLAFVNNMISKRPAIMRGVPGSGPCLSKFIAEHAKAQAELKMMNEAAEQNCGVVSQVKVNSHSAMNDDDGTVTSGPVIVRKGSKAGGKPGTAGGATAAGVSMGPPPVKRPVASPQLGSDPSAPPGNRRKRSQTAMHDRALTVALGVAPPVMASMPATPAGAAPGTPAPPWARGASPSGAVPCTPGFADPPATPFAFSAPGTPAGRTGVGVGVVDLLSTPSQSGTAQADVLASPGEESVDVGRVLLGAKLGRQLRAAFLLLLLFLYACTLVLGHLQLVVWRRCESFRSLKVEHLLDGRWR